MIDALEIIDYFYPESTPLKSLFLKHSSQVRDKALEIYRNLQAEHYALSEHLDLDIVISGAMLHDIGIRECNAPSIHCEGTQPYICHGRIGAEMLREYGRRTNQDLEVFARICERHTGAGLTAENIREQNLPLPEMNFVPETNEEKLVCLADKFFSKSGDLQEKSLERIYKSLTKFGLDTIERFDELCRVFQIH